MKKNIDFLVIKKINIAFCFIGFFIPGFTAFFVIFIQQLLLSAGINCFESWSILGYSALFFALLIPIIFYYYLDVFLKYNRKVFNFVLFILYVIEYIFIQVSLVVFLSGLDSLCVISDAQNGFQFVIYGWVSIPLIISCSYFIQKKMDKVSNNYF